MSRHARNDIDLSALPTVADVEDDDLIDRDDAWHAHQAAKRKSVAAVAEAVHGEHEHFDEVPAEAGHQLDREPAPMVETDAPVEMAEEAAVTDDTPGAIPEMEASFDPVMDPDVFLESDTPELDNPVREMAAAEMSVDEPPRALPPESPRDDRRRVVDTPPESFALQARSELADEAAKSNTNGDEHAGGQHHPPVEVPKPPLEEPLSTEQRKRLYWERLKDRIGLGSLGWSVAIHVALLVLAALIGISQVVDKQVDFLPGGSPASQAASEALEHKVQQKKNPWLKSKPQLRRVTVQSMASEVQLPEMDMESLDLSSNDRMSLGKLGSIGPVGGGMGMGGAGGGFGAGIGKGGMFSFLGQTAFGRRVVFVCDVSASMSAAGEGGVTRFEVLKKELVKSLSRLPHGTQYQILFFSDFAWPHNIVDPKKSAAYEKYRWSITPDDWKEKEREIPRFPYLLANGFSVSESRKIVEEADNPGGTNWGSGLLMALKANPKPDVIFFMTDGNRNDEMGWVDIVTNENKRVRPVSVIHTSVMMETDAAADMDRLAKANGGTFSVVLRDGTVVKGDTFLNR